MEGKSIRLRDFRSEDVPLYEKWMAPNQEWQQWDAPYLGSPKPESVRTHVASVQEGIATGDWADPRWRLVIADKGTNRLIGVVTRYWISKETFWPALGIGIYDPSRWGKGIGYEALGMWCDHLLATVPEYVRLDLRTWSGNERMMRLAERLGFQIEARFRNARIVGGKYYDAVGYGILREEWDARYPDGFR